MLNRGNNSYYLTPFKWLNARTSFAILTVWFAIFAIGIISRSIHWPTIHDGPILLYMVFLTEHGMRLYRDVIEVQFPGSLLLYSFGRHVFGTSDLAFRLFDLSALGIDFIAMLVICRIRTHWFAAVLGFSVLLLLHTGNQRGIQNLGERDFFVTCFLGVAVACLLESYRRQHPSVSIAFGLCVALASTVKPTAILFIVALLPIIQKLRRQKKPIAAYLGWTSFGVFSGYAVVLSYLLNEHAVGAFLQLEKTIMPIYYGMANQSFYVMARHLFEYRFFSLFLILGSISLFLLRSTLRQELEQQVLLVCSILGGASYFLQHKGFWYHREPFFFFFFLWVGWVLVDSILEGRPEYRWTALGLLIVAALCYPKLIRTPEWDGRNEASLKEDLTNLHALDKPGETQCVDETGGCLTVALNSEMVMATGFVTDYLYFLDNRDSRLENMREQYLEQLRRSSPRFVVLTNDQWPTLDHNGYDKLRYWPQFSEFLNDYYVLSIDRGGTLEQPRGYRIYIRKDQSNSSKTIVGQSVKLLKWGRLSPEWSLAIQVSPPGDDKLIGAS